MKVVLFCGGFGTRLREHSDVVPKPLVDVGNRPILLHLMKYYAHYGHTEFILCLGYKGEMIKDFFLSYDSNKYRDFVMSHGGKKIVPEESDIGSWTISFVDTGLHANIGERLLAVRDHVIGEDVFLANYSDQLTDFPLPELIDFHREKEMIASFLSVRPAHTAHHVQMDGNGAVTRLSSLSKSGIWINGGFMVLSREIFDYINPGEELVEEPFNRLLELGKLGSKGWNGFWAAMDTMKDKILFDRMHGRGETLWEVWQKSR